MVLVSGYKFPSLNYINIYCNSDVEKSSRIFENWKRKFFIVTKITGKGVDKTSPRFTTFFMLPPMYFTQILPWYLCSDF